MEEHLKKQRVHDSHLSVVSLSATYRRGEQYLYPHTSFRLIEVFGSLNSTANRVPSTPGGRILGSHSLLKGLAILLGQSVGEKWEMT